MLAVLASSVALELTPDGGSALVPGASPDPLVECGESGCCPKSCSGHGECVNVGELRFTLSWSASTDLDLHVLTPSGDEVWFANTTGGGGELDQDDPSGEANAAENIWFNDADEGTYTYWVTNFDGENPAVWTLDVYRDRLRVEEFTGTMSGDLGAESERRTIDVP